MAAVRQELSAALDSGRIEKIYQPKKEELLIHVRQPGKRYRLLLSAHAANARIHLTGTFKENPASPPLFCMVLRKHLEGGRIRSFNQPGLERVLLIKIEARDELGQPAEKHLICEIMGKHSNIILVDPATNTIIDGIRRYSHAVSRYREVLPGQPYLPPPAQGKLNPLTASEEDFRRAVLSSPLEDKLVNIIQRCFDGFSTVTSRKIIRRASLPENIVLDHCGEYELVRIWQTIRSVAETTAKGIFQPCLLLDRHGIPSDFTAFSCPSEASGNKMNDLLDYFFSTRECRENFNQEKHSLLNLLNREIKHLAQKLADYDQDLAETAGAERFQLFGELLTANLYRLNGNLPEATLENYHGPAGATVTIPLDGRLTPAENAQAYFKRHLKAKNARNALAGLTERAGAELSYLEGVKTSLELADNRPDLAEIKQELAEQGYIATGLKKKKEEPVSQPLHFNSSDRFTILIGKNNRQNDRLTKKTAQEEDIWLHTKDIPGAHVIIRTEGLKVPASTIREAASLAAYFSRARQSQNVPVDYTLKKFVHKPAGARPGMVVYENQKTIFVTPDESLVKSLGAGQGN
jgi:predicted ribosome quality control (RQC) complex YloA/Tae2 family protein